MSDFNNDLLPGEKTLEQAQELAKCYADPIYFCNKYCKALVLDKGLSNITLFPYQETMIKTAVKHRFTIAKLPRQSGKTQAIAFFMCWLILFNPAYKIAIVAQKEKQAMNILKRVKLAYTNLPDWMRMGVRSWNEKSIELDNMSNIVVSGTTASAARGESVDFLYLDEFAFIPPHIQAEFYKSALPTISSGKTTKVMITSTPKGLDLFYKIWVDSEQGNNDFKRIAIEWNEVPGRDDEWKRAQIRALGSEEDFNQEYNADFLGSSTTLIDGQKLRKMTFIRPLKASKDGLSVYKYPEVDHQYVVVADCARGVNQDYHAYVVFDITQSPYRVVAKYQNNRIEPILFAQAIVAICKEYNDAYNLIEVNDVGQQVVDTIYNDYEYENTFSNNTKNQTRTAQLVLPNAVDAKPGIRTSKLVKRIGCSNLKQLIENDRLITEDYEIFEQLTRFTLQKNSYQAEDGHDDLVMTLVLFGWMADQRFFKEWTSTNFRLDLIKQGRGEARANMEVFGFIRDPATVFDENTTPVIDASPELFERWLREDDYDHETAKLDAELDAIMQHDEEEARKRMDRKYWVKL